MSSISTSGRRSAFNPKVVLGMLLFGAVAFIAMLYLIGIGETGRGSNDGGAHAAAKGLTGYAALAELLKQDGQSVSLSRNAGALDRDALLVLTPPHYTDAEELTEIIERRRYEGPTLVILPKWYAARIPSTAKVEAEDGWVVLVGAEKPEWPEKLGNLFPMELAIADIGSSGPQWSGLGRSGKLPDDENVMAFENSDINLIPLVTDSKDRPLAGYLDDGGYYPVLDEAAGVTAADPDELNGQMWNVMYVAEPDLMNNYGMADRERAQLALQLVELAKEGQDIEIVFDLTLNGLGKTQNLLTLAFTPPFLAATLCLIIAMIVVAWRAFRRFGPPLAEARAIAFGKSRLVLNSAAFIQRTGRLHLLTKPYAAMMAARIADLLRLRSVDETEIDAAMARQLPDLPPFSTSANNLRNATSNQDTLRAAQALKKIERTLTP